MREINKKTQESCKEKRMGGAEEKKSEAYVRASCFLPEWLTNG